MNEQTAFGFIHLQFHWTASPKLVKDSQCPAGNRQYVKQASF